VILTPKELRLLDLIARNAGRVLTRQKILDGVWGEETIVRSGVSTNASPLCETKSNRSSRTADSSRRCGMSGIGSICPDKAGPYGHATPVRAS